MSEKLPEKVYASDKPWLKYYEKLGLPTTGKPYPEFPWHEIVDRNAKKAPNGPAVYYEGRKTTWKELKDYSERFATALTDFGLKKGDVVAIRLPNSTAFAISIWGISRTGAIQLWIDPLRAKPEVIRQLNETSCKIIIGLDMDADYLKSLKEDTKLERIIVASKRDYAAEEEKPKEILGTYNLRSLIEKYPPNPPKVDIDPKKDCALLRFTGGATGIPKGVMSSHYNITSCVRQTFGLLFGGSKGFDYVSNILVGMELPVLIPIIMAHLGGFEYIYVSDLGLPIILIPDNRDYDAMVRAIKEYKPILVMAVPGQWAKIEEKMGEMPLIGLPGTAPMSPGVLDRIEEKGGLLTDAIGQSEANVINLANLTGALERVLPAEIIKKVMPIVRKSLPALSAFAPLIRLIPIKSSMIQPILKITLPALMSAGKGKEKAEKHKKSVGQPILDEDVKLISPDSRKEVPAGEPGELYYKGPNLMLGYWPTVGNGIGEDGYLGSGDVYIMDEDGFFEIVDRTKDMINVAGFKVYSEECEKYLCTHPAVFNAAIIGLPDPKRPGAEMVKGYIQLRKGYEPTKELEEELTEYITKSFPPYYKPKVYEFIELPLSSVDKVDKIALRKMEEERRKK